MTEHTPAASRVQQDFARGSNEAWLLRLLHERQTTTRAELEMLTRLSPSTISKVVRRLLETGYATEAGIVPSTGGRPSKQLVLCPEARCAIGAELSLQRLRVAVTDLNASIGHIYEVDTPALDIERIAESLGELIAQVVNEVGRERIVGVGIAVPGVADTARGRMVLYSDLNLRDYPLAARIQATTGFFPLLYNRSTSAAMGEKWQGDGRHVQSLFYLALDAGVSGGLILRGQSYQGASPAVGEIGHFTVLPDGPTCFCGNRGCLQTVASSGALAQRARELIKQGQPSTLSAAVDGHLDLVDGLMVLRAANAGDPLATQVLAEAADYVGLAVGNVINLVSPEMVVLGGPMVWACPEPWVGMIQASIQRRTLAVTIAGTQIVVSRLGRNSRCIGAAALTIRHWLTA